MIEVRKYTNEYKEQWNYLISDSKNVSFLFHRNFMEYHCDRFDDYSLIFLMAEKIVAALPANRKDSTVYSHQGLSYGAFILKKEIKLIQALEIFRAALRFMYQDSCSTFIFKSFPRIYNTIPSDEIDWALTICKASLYRRDSALTINNADPLPYQERRMRSIKKAGKLNPVIRLETTESGIDIFWENVLIPNMLDRFGIAPVHTAAEMKMLFKKFPDNIMQYNIYSEDEIMAGCTMFLNPNVAHAQYISGTEKGRQNGCLDYLFNHLIKSEFREVPFFDFGNSNEEAGTAVNRGLLDWKEGFGARAISHDFYEVLTENYQFLDRVIDN
jgi:hypothetical protein